MSNERNTPTPEGTDPNDAVLRRFIDFYKTSKDSLEADRDRHNEHLQDYPDDYYDYRLVMEAGELGGRRLVLAGVRSVIEAIQDEAGFDKLLQDAASQDS
jgi:hypothetical protein